ncbi:CPBP family intramembrane glutamic endopeptidase [Ligilactobacillus saerimneri]|uniref:CPBP family intramembrane glutamic endopeptidase n=1 Tax=Ligilactobacillus saerimneri TaxID=228229 RepID=UPI0030B916B8
MINLRRLAWIIAMLVSSLAFGMMHYNAYNWNLFQMLVTIGLTRIPFDWAWYKTDSLWTGIIGHIIFDLLAFLVGAMAAFA